MVATSSGARQACTTAIPFDNSIPQQSTEGDEVLTLAITPKSATSTLLINYVCETFSSAGVSGTAALFQDAGANAIATLGVGASGTGIINFDHYMTSGTTSSTTFKIRLGPSSGTIATNSSSAGVQVYNGVGVNRLTITEYL